MRPGVRGIGAGIAVFAASLLTASPAFAVTAGAVTVDDRLLTFDTASPGTITSGPRAISGLQPGETVQGIDVRPATNQLYANGSSGRLYRINPATAAATQVGSPFEIPVAGGEFGFDANPTVDRIRVVSDADQNFRLHPDTGAQVDFNPGMPGTQLDQNLDYATGDENDGANPRVAGVAYTNNFAGATTTTLYGIDTGVDRLVTLNPPNNGTLNTVGPLSFNAEGPVGFDIRTVPAGNTGFAAMNTPSPTTSALYTVDLMTGAVTPVGNIGGGAPVKGLAVGVPPSIEPEPAPSDPGPTGTTPEETTPTPDTTSPEALLALAATQKLKRVRKAGVVGAELSCDEACTATASLAAGKKALGAGVAALAEAGVGEIEVDLTKAGDRFLKKRAGSDARKTRLGLAITVTDSAENATSLTRRLTLTH